MKIPLFINSSKNEGTDSNFVVEFNPPIELNANKENKICLVKNSMSYSWYNVSSELNNHQLKYSHDSGTSWTTITIRDGHYNYENLNAFIQNAISLNGHSMTGVTITFENQYYMTKVTLETTYRLDIRSGDFHVLLGFDKVLINTTTLGSKLSDITMSFNNLCIHVDKVSNTYRNGKKSDILHCEAVGTQGKVPTYPFSYDPKHLLWCKIDGAYLKNLRIYLMDHKNRIYNLRGSSMQLTLMITNEEV